MRPAAVVGLLWLGALAGCDQVEPPVVACASTAGPSAPDDALVVQPLLGEAPRGGETDVLVRVDSLHLRGAVSFSTPPPTNAAAVSLALTTDATFQGCLNPAPGGFRLHAAEAPRGRLWIRISSNRPVVVHAPRVAASTARAPDGDDGPPGARAQPDAESTLTVLPGTSGRARWEVTPDRDEPR